jgi:hypothetical protein
MLFVGMSKFGLRAGGNHVHTNNIVMGSPNIDIDSVEDGEEGEAPRNAVNNNLLSLREELVDNRSQQEDVNQRPKTYQLVEF